MPLTLRQQVLLSFQAFDDTLHRAQSANRRSAWTFGEFNIRACISHIVPLTAELRNASLTCEKILDLIDKNLPPLTRADLPSPDVVLRMLERSRDGFNSTKTFQIAEHKTNSNILAVQLEELINQLGGATDA